MTKKGDRQLLELAAKAVGMELEWFDGMNEDTYDQAIHNGDVWDPLNDDGDAFRLAVTLGLRIDASFRTGPNDTNGVGVWTPGDQEFYPPFWQIGAKDPFAATRGAIVRAAAEIGKAMP